MQQHKAFTSNYSGLINTPHTPISILNEKGEILHSGVALWDTGAQMSCINGEVATRLGFPIIDTSSVGGVGGRSESNLYLVRVLLPSNVPAKLTLHGLKEDIGCDILIGMDIIAQGDFAISGFGGKTTLSFCLPARHRIDFVEQVSSVPPRRIRPNDPCYCDSGTKYKKCCGKNPSEK